jgi:hypothetical protein
MKVNEKQRDWLCAGFTNCFLKGRWLGLIHEPIRGKPWS